MTVPFAEQQKGQPMTATIHHLPVSQPASAPFPSMTEAELEKFRQAVTDLRHARRQWEQGCTSVAAALSERWPDGVPG